MTTTKYAKPIYARVSQAATQKVTRMFSANTEDILNELLQNSRRAGSTRVDIATHAITQPDGSKITTVTVTDDGRGIDDPSILLTFGESDWDSAVTHSEDPAGMGILALAKIGCTIRWRQAQGNGYHLHLTADHFLGKVPAHVAADETAPSPHGTSISFDTIQNINVRTPAKHYPLPVSLNGEIQEQCSFLEDALHTEEWQGVNFGVYRNRYPEDNLNFYGLTLRIGTPEVMTIDRYINHWRTKVDVINCSELELVLPARKEVVTNEFLAELQDASRLATYRAIASAKPAPTLPYRQYQRALAGSVSMPAPQARLAPWTPRCADPDRTEPKLFQVMTAEELTQAIMVPESSETLNIATQQALYRAAGLAGIQHRLFQECSYFRGYRWYDQLQQLVSVETKLIFDGIEQDLQDLEEIARETRPEAVAFTIRIKKPGNSNIFILRLKGDVALADEEYGIDDPSTKIFVATNSQIMVPELSELLRAAFFIPHDDKDSDSYETQEYHFDEEAQVVATAILIDSETAIINRAVEIVRQQIGYHIPAGQELIITARSHHAKAELHPLTAQQSAS